MADDNGVAQCVISARAERCRSRCAWLTVAVGDMRAWRSKQRRMAQRAAAVTPQLATRSSRVMTRKKLIEHLL